MQATLGRHALRFLKEKKRLAKGSAYLESLSNRLIEQLQRQKEHGHPWHILSFVQTKPFLVRDYMSTFNCYSSQSLA